MGNQNQNDLWDTIEVQKRVEEQDRLWDAQWGTAEVRKRLDALERQWDAKEKRTG